MCVCLCVGICGGLGNTCLRGCLCHVSAHWHGLTITVTETFAFKQFIQKKAGENTYLPQSFHFPAF